MERGPVDIKGVTTRTNTSGDRRCTACKRIIPPGKLYERVARLDDTIESYGTRCFEEEFGPREAYDISDAAARQKQAAWLAFRDRKRADQQRMQLAEWYADRERRRMEEEAEEAEAREHRRAYDRAMLDEYREALRAGGMGRRG